eukprot:401173-Pyramimonas_sp.AAC.1
MNATRPTSVSSARRGKKQKTRNLRYRNSRASSAKFVHASGVQVAEHVERDPGKKQEIIHECWAKQFLATEVSPDAQDEFLERFGRRWD